MLRVRDACLCGLLFWAHATAAPPNAAGAAENSRDAGSGSIDADSRRKLAGRFLHITGTSYLIVRAESQLTS